MRSEDNRLVGRKGVILSGDLKYGRCFHDQQQIIVEAIRM